MMQSTSTLVLFLLALTPCGLACASLDGTEVLTEVSLGEGAKLFVNGSFVERDSMWPGYSLVYWLGYENAVRVLNEGKKVGRTVLTTDNQSFMYNPRLEWSGDRDVLFTWLDSNGTLAALNASTGDVRELMSLPPLRPSPYDKRPETPHPLKVRSIFHDSEEERALVMIVRWVEFAFDFIGYQEVKLVAVSLEDASVQVVVEGGRLPAEVYSWDYSPKRKEVVLLTDGSGRRVNVGRWSYHARRLEVRGSDGTRLHQKELGPGGGSAVSLSHDQQLVLVQRLLKPGFESHWTGGAGHVERAVSTVDRDIHGSFIVLDARLENVVGGVPLGRNAVWSPVGHRIAFTAAGSVLLYDVTSKKMECIVTNRNSLGVLPDSVDELPELAWSADGSKLAVSYRMEKWDAGSGALLLDLEQHEYMLLVESVDRMTWGSRGDVFMKEAR